MDSGSDGAMSPRRRTLGFLSGGVGLLLVLGVGATVILGGGGPDHPDDWDPRVADLVAFVEDERGLEFDHAVHVDFLTPEEYSETTRAEAADLTDEDRAAIEDSEAVLRALGLVSGDIDLFESSNELSDSGTLAYYDDATERITVRGTDMTVDLEVTLVHELTHALQDQHFDLGRLHEMETTGESSAFRAVVEGDASLVEQRYVENLDAAAGEDYLAAVEEQMESAPYADIPAILSASFGAPYALGTPLVGIVEADGGWDAVDALLDEPPVAEVELLDPIVHLDGFTVQEVELPEAGDGVEVVEESDFGAVTLFLMLATRMDPLVALDAADGWAGDAYRTERDGAVLCTTISTVAADEDATDLLEDALVVWADAADADVDRDGDVVTLRSCDRDEGLPDPVTDPIDALSVPTTRSYVIQGTVAQLGASPHDGACVGDEVIAEVPLEVLIDPEPSDDELDQFFEAMGAAGKSCGVT